MQNYDYIITGSGASGLMLAYRMAKDSFFDNASILIIDKEKKTSNDRTWCFWENGEGEWDELLHKSWDKILFDSNIYKNTIPLQSYAFTSILDTAEGVFVETSIGQYRAVKLLNSVDFDQKYTRQEEYPVLLQHFTGWFIETKINYFDDSVATFMDFTVDQKRNTRFMYVLPISPNKALFEYTNRIYYHRNRTGCYSYDILQILGAKF